MKNQVKDVNHQFVNTAQNCALCNVTGVLFQLGQNFYCEPCKEKMQSRLDASRSIVIDRKKLFDLKTLTIISQSCFVYLALRIDGYHRKGKTGDATQFCPRWGLTKAQLLSALSRLSRKGDAAWTAQLWLEVPSEVERTTKENSATLDIDSPDVSESTITVTIKTAQSWWSSGLITPRAYLYFYLVINGVGGEVTLEDLASKTAISKDMIATYLAGFSNRGIAKIDFNEFSASTFTMQDKISEAEKSFSGLKP